MQNKFSLKIYKTFDELESIREVWNSLVQHPNAEYDFYKTIVESRKEVISPCLFAVYCDNRIITMFITRIELSNLPLNIGYFKLSMPRVKFLQIIYGGIVGEYDGESFKIILDEIMRMLKRKKIDLVCFHMIERDKPFIENLIDNLTRNKVNYLISRKNTHRKMELPADIDSFYSNMKRKHRNFYKNLEKAFSGNVTYQVFKEQADIDRIFHDIEVVAKVSYQRGLGVGFHANEEYRQRFELLLSRGMLRAYLLYINSQPCAYWTGTVFKKVLHLNEGAYDATFNKYSPGICLYYKMVEDLIQNEDITTLDFGFGEAHYKERFSTDYFYENTVNIYSRSLKMTLLFGISKISSSMSEYLEQLLDKHQIKDKVKRLWRNKLQSKSK